ncbi:MAG TPA: HlyC/CorC family transporter [Erythrobacter sp.]|jgi:CBS domain containing-hemolysin-like protein|uniref:CBS domain containing-hemolysin-like protein n=2 Tax=Qipengyuania citrea TaxID=225971 RepID=A0A6I4UC92_9SPHN|nr:MULTISPECIES: hemolysin family protein [Erythrobacteraceae]MAQ29325.1 HlyC/CorC family transporter [Erythrobacter sp.]MCZ4265169.1 hemolysin family protein [Erythrobacter sp. G21629-S1]KNH02399.1 magnesium and cobalt transporter [Qipengyuania citrea LAMA 915]KZX89118.1 magnesium/cobalt efflux protein [Erythrobacter sp. HI0019]KZY01209.1 magnesium/cobalt efflux protein [Erythrobacter sp. HI0028]|tara:strand:- start:1429 stop:2346 length:918 start_codon:yes stop_codon:yes gene_type:complete
MPDSSSPAGDAESSSGLILAIRKFFDPDHGERSLRAQLEDAIDEHEDENGEDTPEHSGTGDLSLVERQMLRNLLHFSEHDADDVAVPRGQIIAIEATASWDQLVETFAEHGHSRMPVYREQLDDVIGMIHIKDVFTILARGETPPGDWTVLLRQPLYVPQTRNALDVLADMRAQRMHLAIVVDEFSGTDGLITIEDLVEEIVGEIEDEHDDAPEQWIVDIGGGMWDCDARAELEDVARQVSPAIVEVEESVDTLGGVAFVLAEQVPEVGRVLEHPSGWRIEVIDGDETHVTRLRLHAPDQAATPG